MRGLLALLSVVAASPGHIYFYSASDTLVRVARPDALNAKMALTALLRGPTPDERRRRIRTTLPFEKLAYFGVVRQTATIRFRGYDLGVVANVESFRRLDQVVLTATSNPGIRQVRLYSNGHPWGVHLMTGGLQNTFTRHSVEIACHGTIWVGSPPC